MSVLTSHPKLRWLVPVSAAVAVLGGGAAIGAVTALADSSLPPRSAAELLVDLQNARLDAFSGTVVARADLGLPPMPGMGAGSSDLTALAGGTHTLRVWYSGPDKARVALLGTLDETDVITNGTDVWTWSSKQNTATHRTLAPGEKPALPSPLPTASGLGLTPEQIATMALTAIDPTTTVSTDGSASVAGRSAYELVLSPKDPASLIGSVSLAIDAQEHVPLRVQVRAKGATDPVIEVAFTQVSFAQPDPDEFVFKGPTVEAPATGAPDGPGATKPDASKPEAKPASKVIGTGWTSVLAVRPPADNAQAKTLQNFVAQLPAVSGSWGSGHILAGSLFSVLLTDDGRLLVGAVSPLKLYQAAADPAAQLPA
jgi:outer membrane lipoprotein-sorting protein